MVGVHTQRVEADQLCACAEPPPTLWRGHQVAFHAVHTRAVERKHDPPLGTMVLIPQNPPGCIYEMQAPWQGAEDTALGPLVVHRPRSKAEPPSVGPVTCVCRPPVCLTCQGCSSGRTEPGRCPPDLPLPHPRRGQGMRRCLGGPHEMPSPACLEGTQTCKQGS